MHPKTLYILIFSTVKKKPKINVSVGINDTIRAPREALVKCNPLLKVTEKIKQNKIPKVEIADKSRGFIIFINCERKITHKRNNTNKIIKISDKSRPQQLHGFHSKTCEYNRRTCD